MKKISRKGRPRKDAITKLKVMAWFRAVAEASGKTSAQLEREFANPDHIRRSKDKNQEIRPGLWDKYRRGEVEPRALPINGKPLSIVQAVEAKYPGTARVLTLPLWTLLDYSKPVTIEELDTIQKTLSPEVQRLHKEENVLARMFANFENLGEVNTISLQNLISNAIELWTLQAISTRKRMLLHQEDLIGLMRTRLETAAPRKQQRERPQKSKNSQMEGKISMPQLKQKCLFD